MYRTDEFADKYNSCDLYRGGGQTEEETNKYVLAKGKGIQLFGYTSTSPDKNVALKFAWQNQHSGHHKVLFHIKWKSSAFYYYLNAGAYDHEKEVLLVDGAFLTVESVEEVLDTNGKKLHTLITLKC